MTLGSGYSIISNRIFSPLKLHPIVLVPSSTRTRRRVLQRVRIPPIRDSVRVRNCVIRKAIKLIINLVDPCLEPTKELVQFTETVLVAGVAALDSGERDDGVVEDETNVGRGVGGGAGEDLADHVGGEGRKGRGYPCLYRGVAVSGGGMEKVGRY